MKTLIFVTLLTLSITVFAKNDDFITVVVQGLSGKTYTKKQMPAIPDGYQLKTMYPHELGTFMLLPNDWHYKVYPETEKQPYATNIISKENLDTEESYKTGLKITLFTKLMEEHGVSGENYASAQVGLYKKLAKRTIREGFDGAGLYICEAELPLVENSKEIYHIVATYRWVNEEPNVLIISTFGAPIEEWKTAKKHFDTMMEYENKTTKMTDKNQQ